MFFSRKRIGKPFFYTGKLSASTYQEALVYSELVTKPATFVMSGHPILIHDGDTSHSAASTQQFLDQAGIRYVHKGDWPPNSPDLNPTENLLSIIGWHVTSKSRRSVSEVKTAVLESVADVPIATLRNLCDSFADRCHNVIEARGLYSRKY